VSAQPQVLAVDWQGGLSDAWADIVTFVPKLLIFGVILLVGWFVAKALAKVVDRVLERVGFDGAVERGGVKQALSRSSYDASDLVAQLVKYAILLFTLVIAFNVFGPNPISELLQDVIAFLPKLIVAIVIVVVASAIAKVVKDLVASALGSLSYGNVVANIASIFILFLGVVAALNQVGVATTVTTPVLVTILATIAGVIIVGVGGGLVRPMQARWDRWLARAEIESINLREQVHRSSGPRHQGDPLRDDYRDQYASTGGGLHASDPSLETRQL
jgi:Conserved TM helix